LIGVALVFLGLLNRAGTRDKSFDAKDLIGARFAQLTALEKKYTRIMKWTRRSGNLLSFTQYVIGVVVASSYFQGSSSKELIGFLGLSVVVATAIQQRYRPELRSRKAERAVATIRALKRDAEDRLSKRHLHHEVLTMLTHGINRIERDESIDPDVPLNDSPVGSGTAPGLPLYNRYDPTEHVSEAETSTSSADPPKAS